ncbi:MAG TPA: T9SS type A sorting domain-containing protein, partial [Bacteroidota bacterium]|nr:T9SS type A sorting domain-containing protein [Bacteroidota bacterium]
ISVRPRSWPKWTGVSYWDDFSFNAIDNAVPTSVRPDFNPIVGGVPLAYSLEQNYPNPFNPSTRFRFSLPQAQRVSVKIYDVIGREVAVLAQDLLQAGTYTLEWNAAKVPSGVYFYRLEAGDFSAVKKMLLLK